MRCSLVIALLGCLVLPGAAQAKFQLVPTVGLGDELTCIGISHRDPNFVMIGTSTGRIHRTTDGGKTWQEVWVSQYRSLFFGRERHDDPRLEYALGLPGKSPHLQSWLRQKGLHTSGVNLQQLLVKEGDKPVRINWIEVDWHDENRVWVGTGYGLYRSVNKGRSFIRIWQGRSGQADRTVNAVVTDPGDPKVLMVGTAGGLYISRQRGVGMKKEMNFYVHGGYVRGLFYDRELKGLVHMAMGGASMASPDHGKNWITTHWHLWHPRSQIQWISLGPNNIRAIATADGVWASWQGGEMGTWQRRGYRLTKRDVISVMISQQANVWFAATRGAIWRSDDYGNDWNKVMQIGGKESPRWMVAHANDPRHFWMITNRHVYRWGGVPGIRRVLAKRAPRRILDTPTLYQFWKHVMKYKKLYFKDHQRYRDRAPWASLLPDVMAGGTYTRSLDDVKIRAFPHLYMPWVYNNRLNENGLNFYVFASWDLSRLIFDRRELPHFGRVERGLQSLRVELTDRIHTLYTEYRGLVHGWVYGPPQDLLTREMQRLRLQEIAAFFDSISGGYWTRKTGGIR